MKKIFLNTGEATLVSDEDFIYLVPFNWCKSPSGYVIRRVDYKITYMHRVILERMGFTDFEQGDHINSVPLDNRRENLRPATHQQNSYNQRTNICNTSGYKGVSWYKRKKKWHARIQVYGVSIHLGYFDDPKSAARAYNAAAREHFGEFARLNEV